MLHKLTVHILSIVLLISLSSCSSALKDSYSSSGEGRKLNIKFKDRYASSGNIGIRNPLKYKDSYGGSSGRRNQIGFKDSFGGNNGRKISFKHKDSFSSKRKSSRRGYKDPEKKWWMIGGKRARQGRSKHNPDSYGAKPKKRSLPKKKKKIKRTTKFEGMK